MIGQVVGAQLPPVRHVDLLMRAGEHAAEDWQVAPGGSLTFTNLLAPQTDLRLDYRCVWNNSSDAAHIWQDQVATLAIVVRR